MECKKCGAALAEDATYCSGCGEPVNGEKKRRKPIFPIRVVLRLTSLALCLVLTVCLLATALLADVQVLTSIGGIQTILSHMAASEDADTPATADPAAASCGVVRLRAVSDISLPQSAALSAHLGTAAEALVDLVADVVEELLGRDLPVSPEQVQTFLKESTIIDFITAKTASLVQDALNGTANTTITADELLQLMDENEPVIEKTFQVEITEEMKQDMLVQLEEAVVDTDINATLQQSVDQVLQQEVPGTGGMTVSEVMVKLQAFTGTELLLIAAGVCLALIILLFALNYYNLPRGMRLTASACLISGLLLSAPLALIQAAPSLLAENMPETAGTLGMLGATVAALAPVHYGLLAIGVVLLVISVLWRAMTKNK